MEPKTKKENEVIEEVVIEEVVVEEVVEEKLATEPTVKELRIRSARRAFGLNLVMGILFALIFIGGVVMLYLATSVIGTDNGFTIPGLHETVTKLIFSLAGIVLMVVGAILTFYFFGHLVQCVRDMKDPERKDAVKDHHI